MAISGEGAAENLHPAAGVRARAKGTAPGKTDSDAYLPCTSEYHIFCCVGVFMYSVELELGARFFQ